MPDRYDPLPDLALLLDAALRAGWSALPYVDRLTEGLGLELSGGPAAAEKLLRDALGLPACRCAISGTSEVIPPACPVHGVPCERCGEIEECADRCGADPAGTVTDLRAQAPVTVWRDGDCLLVPALRLDWAGRILPRAIINREMPGLAAAPAATAEQSASCAYCEDDPDHPEPDNAGSCTCSSPGCGRGWCPQRDDQAAGATGQVTP